MPSSSDPESVSDGFSDAVRLNLGRAIKISNRPSDFKNAVVCTATHAPAVASRAPAAVRRRWRVRNRCESGAIPSGGEAIELNLSRAHDGRRVVAQFFVLHGSNIDVDVDSAHQPAEIFET